MNLVWLQHGAETHLLAMDCGGGAYQQEDDDDHELPMQMRGGGVSQQDQVRAFKSLKMDEEWLSKRRAAL